MFRPSWDHVWPSFPSIPARALKFSRLDQLSLRPMYMECLQIRPFLDHDIPRLAIRLASAVRFSSLDPSEHNHGIYNFHDHRGP